MAPPLALLGKDFLIDDCLPPIQEFAADKRAPHPAALLIKNIESGNVRTQRRWRQRFLWYGPRSDDWRQRVNWFGPRDDGVFTQETMEDIERTNKRLRKAARSAADRYNSMRPRPNIHPCLNGMQQEMQGCRFLPGSLTSCPERYGITPVPYLNKPWTARGWSKRGSKRKRVSSYRNNRVDTDSD